MKTACRAWDAAPAEETVPKGLEMYRAVERWAACERARQAAEIAAVEAGKAVAQ